MLKPGYVIQAIRMNTYTMRQVRFPNMVLKPYIYQI